MNRLSLVKQIMNLFDWNESDLARELQINRSTVNRWLSKSLEISDEKVLLIQHYVSGKNPLVDKSIKQITEEIK